MATKLQYKTILLSDVHLGTADCKIDEVNHFLKSTRCERLILNGDIIDGWSLASSGRWTKDHTRFIRLILKKVEKEETEVIYLRGNHDGILSRFLPLSFDKISVQENYIWEAAGGRYLVFHGDIFDLVTRNFVIVAHLGDMGYRLLLKLNRLYNQWRSWRGKEYYSISKAIKARAKSAVNFVSKFEAQITQAARDHACQGVVCGHIHVAADKYFEEVHYLNCGDWVETLSAVVEHLDGRLELLNYKDFCLRLAEHKVEADDFPDVLEEDVLESSEAFAQVG